MSHWFLTIKTKLLSMDFLPVFLLSCPCSISLLYGVCTCGFFCLNQHLFPPPYTPSSGLFNSLYLICPTLPVTSSIWPSLPPPMTLLSYCNTCHALHCISICLYRYVYGVVELSNALSTRSSLKTSK